MAEFVRAAGLVRPDYVLTVNHYGVDAPGAFMEALDRLRLPLASWLVDNPELILYRYDHLIRASVAVFSTSREAMAPVRARGYEHVFHLPLGTTPSRFAPPAAPPPADHPWRARASFVGNSWIGKIVEQMEKGPFPRELLRRYRQDAARFEADPTVLPAERLRRDEPELYRLFRGMRDLGREQAWEVLVIWEANRRYRVRCLERLMPFQPLVAGDATWLSALRRSRPHWRHAGPIDYYAELPRFYPCSDVNFNCSSVHMRGALNQRLFDAPACGAFVVTDWQPGLEECFEPDREVVCYRSPEEIPDVVGRWLEDPAGRRRVVQAARRRVLAEHSYVHRLRRLDETMAALHAAGPA